MMNSEKQIETLSLLLKKAITRSVDIEETNDLIRISELMHGLLKDSGVPVSGWLDFAPPDKAIEKTTERRVCEELGFDPDDDLPPDLFNHHIKVTPPQGGRKYIQWPYSQADQVIANEEVKAYVKARLYEPVSDREFADVETGFRLVWNYAEGQLVGNESFHRAVGLYLAAIESPMSRGKMIKIVDLILDFMDENG